MNSTAYWGRYLWPLRMASEEMVSFDKKTRRELGEPWWSWYRWIPDRFRSSLGIAFAFIGTHNHFAFDRGGKVFNQTAPVIKLPPQASEDEHFSMLGLLNSSTSCFWMKQVCFPKGGDHVGQEGARVRRSLWDERYNYNCTTLRDIPVPASHSVKLVRQIDKLAQELTNSSPSSRIAEWRKLQRTGQNRRSLREMLDAAYQSALQIRGEMILMQEDLDWETYQGFGLTDQALVSGVSDRVGFRAIEPGMRAFELVLAEDIAAGRTQSSWFERHGIHPLTRIDAPDVDASYLATLEKRVEAIRVNPLIALIEKPEYKRRWYNEIWGDQRDIAISNCLLDHLESYFDFDGRMNDEGKPTARLDIALTTVGKLADIARQDPDFLQVGELYRDDPAFDVTRLVAELVEGESVPLLPILRYKPSGLRKREEWENTWTLQRREDAIDARTTLPKDGPRHLSELDAKELKKKEVGTIPVPPKYTSTDFLKGDYWRLRGKLDVPKERWVCFPHCEGEDGTLMVAWAGYDHLQFARAISAYYVNVQERLGGREDPRLVPLLACLIELLPWLKQWHNEVDPEFGVPMGDYFEGFLQEESRNLGLTLAEIKAWRPPQRAARRPRTSGAGSRSTSRQRNEDPDTTSD